MSNPTFNFVNADGRRDPANIMLIGLNGTGKTYFEQHVLPILAEREPRQLIIPANPRHEAWKHLPVFPTEDILLDTTGLYMHQMNELNGAKRSTDREIFFYEMGKALNALDRPTRMDIISGQRLLFEAVAHPIYGLVNAAVVFDDFKNYITDNQRDPVVVNLLNDRRQRDLDIIMACHNPMDVPPYMLEKNPLIILYATSSGFASSRAKLGEKLYEQLEEAKERCDRNYLKGKEAGDPVLMGWCEPILINLT